MNGEMAEAQSNTAMLSDVKSGDFARFFQFAYTGDYSSPAALVDDCAALERGSEGQQQVATTPSIDENGDGQPESMDTPVSLSAYTHAQILTNQKHTRFVSGYKKRKGAR